MMAKLSNRRFTENVAVDLHKANLPSRVAEKRSTCIGFIIGIAFAYSLYLQLNFNVITCGVRSNKRKDIVLQGGG